MPLTLRATRLSRDPNANDWSIYEDGAEIGRLYEDRQANRPENRWFWSITVMGPARFRVRTDSRAATLDQAKADFQAAWHAFKAFQDVDERCGVGDRHCNSDGSHCSDDQLHDPLPNCDPRSQ
jgi:hypothetical protein